MNAHLVEFYFNEGSEYEVTVDNAISLIGYVPATPSGEGANQAKQLKAGDVLHCVFAQHGILRFKSGDFEGEANVQHGHALRTVMKPKGT